MPTHAYLGTPSTPIQFTTLHSNPHVQVVDICPPARRPGVLLGAVGALAAGIGGWLAYMGVDL